MPILGLHVVIALFFAVHVVRSGREQYWLWILFSFPLLGSIVYFFAIYLPTSRLQSGVRKAATAAVRSLDPGRELREAELAFDMTPTAQNQVRLAQAQLEAGNTEQAVRQFEASLSGPFAADSHIRMGAARAWLQHGQPLKAAELLVAIRSRDPEFCAEQLSLLLAAAWGAAGREPEARAEYCYAASRFGTIQARMDYASWTVAVGDVSTAMQMRNELEKASKYWPRHVRSHNTPLLRQLDAALARARELQQS